MSDGSKLKFSATAFCNKQELTTFVVVTFYLL